MTKLRQTDVPSISVVILASLCALGCSEKNEPSAVQHAPSSAVARPEPDVQATAIDPEDGADQLARAADALQNGRFDEVLSLSRAALISQPGKVQWVFLAARAKASLGDQQAAIEILSTIPTDHPEAGLPALGMTADLLTALGMYDQAVDHYRKLLAIDPTATVAHRQLAALLNRLGQRQSAIEHLRVLCTYGDVLQQELASLICCKAPATSDPMGPIAKARQAFARDEFDTARSLLTSTTDNAEATSSPEGVAMLGRIATETQDRSATQLWWRRINDQQSSLAEHWYALALLAMRHLEQPKIAADLLIEAVIRDPTDWGAYGLLENQMNRIGNESAETDFRNRALKIKRSILASNRIAGIDSPKLQDVEPLAQLLDDLHRPLEANLWRYLAVANATPATTSTKAELENLQRRHQELVRSGESFATIPMLTGAYQRHAEPQSLRREVIQRLESAVPWLAKDSMIADATKDAIPASDLTTVPVRMRDRASEVGLHFQYDNATPRKLRDFLIYEQFGGGVAVLDYDLNGNVDLYFGQAAGVPLKSIGEQPNCLFRQMDGLFTLVTNEACADDREYSLGVSAGDLNQDGFEDVVVCNFGTNTRLINQGDGTFKLVPLDEAWQHSVWTSAIAIGDVNNDNLPDVIEVNYLDDPAVFDIPPLNEQGRRLPNRGPESYQPASDRVLLQQQDSHWKSHWLATSEDGAAPGLGIVLANIDRSDGNEFFIANDTRPNQLWKVDPLQSLQEPVWRDVAKVLGCAYSAQGGSGASMGIAAADFDNNGELDFHVTNFYNEAVHFYLQDRQHTFTDAVIPSGMYGDSMPVLGFGTAAFDMDNDGAMDIAVLNGHIEDLRFKDAPFKMLAQLFRQRFGKFSLVSSESLAKEDSGNYFTQPNLGRGLVRLDWNRDGNVDLVATHLDRPAALLENQTKSGHQWLQIELVGTVCERRAVGAIVTVETDRGVWTDWMTSGDGYSSRQEPCLFFGLGDSTEVKQITVRWPDASEETFGPVSLGQRVLLTQHQPIWVWPKR